MSITEFLLARIAEDKDLANHAKWAMQGEWFTTAEDKIDEYVRSLPPDRTLRECEARRRIVERHKDCGLGYGYCDDGGKGIWREEDGGPSCADQMDLAATYSDHPDYRDEWADAPKRRPQGTGTPTEGET